MNVTNIENLAEKVVQRVKEKTGQTFEVEASGRHIHLSEEDLKTLCGENFELNPVKYLSQPGQFVSQLRLTIVGPKGHLNNVVVLGPVRKNSQVEVSLTDGNTLGLKAPIRMSGDIEGTPGITIVNGNKSITIQEGLIVAKRHIHVKTSDKEKLGVTNGEIVKVKVLGKRPLIFDDVVIRIDDDFATYMHIDFDEANACGSSKGTQAYIVRG
ncbi:ethanolamine utilization phosphate acetyltransferase EutD [Ignavigranum ruoffiae]|uniref:Phosphate propanoyltransferase n=1 Tax=Ignavigranum ruoffiae TaxID=89093 RepID=A0A1H9CDL3_9LACT|nr:ethanolamine utilization phosphate acetyltransferase EutD [Ignavigranum ruoffiae]SEP99320.1 Propanediol utilization protein [Ignavigranum ruoffiae]